MMWNMAYNGLSQHVDFLRLSNPTERFELLDLIGEGTYGEVYSAKDKHTGRKYAVKILESIADNIEEIEEEYLVLRDLSKHPNIPDFAGLFLKRGATVEDDQLWFVLELCTGGSVTDLVQGLRNRGSRLTNNQIAYILRETVHALVFLHENHCMHRDIKGHNILLTENGHVKLVDFGVSSHLAATMARRNTSVGTPYWMAPEVIACEQQLDQSYDSRCDVWSIGITAIELAEGDPPLCELHPMRALFQIPRNPPPRLTHPENYSAMLSDFISECLVKDLEQRPFSKELITHPFLKNVGPHVDQVRYELKTEIQKQRSDGRAPRQAEATTKYGKLKSDRKSKPQKMYIDDLAALDVLTEDTIVEQLQKRFENNQIYTYIGDILVAVNPFSKLGLYTTFHQKKYSGKTRSDNPPHIFAVADAAHQALVHQKQNQAIVISGESGSGKTESANLLLKQLVFLGKAVTRNLEERILQVNPIMEAFGNARTGINSNSSRFGKYLELTMARSGKVNGARIFVYLLEQSRVVKQAEAEGNFHIFYYMYDGLQAEKRLEEYYLHPSYRKTHRYLQETATLPKTNVERWKQLLASFKVLGFRDDEVDMVNRVLAAILNLGDMEFGEMDSNDNTDSKARVIDVAPMHRVSKLLGVESADLLEALTSNSVVTRGETITRHNNVAEACTARDAMAKGLYGRLFDWMVNQINSLLVHNKPNNNPEQLAVGLLDIFGFENFNKNSFEQLCINIANEQIQYYFNQHIFTWEQQEYMAEGIPVDLVEFADNRPVLDMLLSRPLGLLALLDEESRFPRSNDRSLIEKFHNNIKSKFYQRPKSDAVCFAIHHFAGRVVYQADGFLEKNRNFLPAEIIQLIRQSQYDMIRFLFQCPITKTGNLYSAIQDTGSRQNVSNFIKVDTKEKFNSRGLASQSRAQQTVATYFRYSLMDLLQKMVTGTPQFIRCIKPNDMKAAKSFEPVKVLKQLRYTGVLETIRIRQHGFSHRLAFAEFLKRYHFLGYGFEERVVASRESCRLLLVRLKMDGWALGKSKVFLKYYHFEYLSKLYEEHVRKIILVQACVRRWLAKAFIKREKQMAAQRVARSAVTLQKHVRGWLTRRRMNKLLREKQEKERIERERLEKERERLEKERERLEKERQAREKKNNEQNKAKQAFARAKLIHQMSNSELIKPSEKHSVDMNNKENEKAAIVIQSYYRGYTIRKMKLTPELEAKTKYILGIAKNRVEAQRMMQKEGFSKEDAARIIQRFYRTHKSKNSNKEGSRKKGPAPQPSKPLSAKDQQVDLIAFSQNVHMLNQEIHKNLRATKTGIPLDAIEKLPNDYKRPPGFVLVPGLLGTVPGGEFTKYSSFRSSGDCDHEMTKELIQSPVVSPNEFEDVSPWDMPFYELERNLRSQRQRNLQQQQQHQRVDVNRNDIIGDRKVELSERKQQLSNNWHQAFQGNETTVQDNKFKGMVRSNNHHNNEPAHIRHIPAFSYLNPNGHQILRYSPNNVEQHSPSPSSRDQSYRQPESTPSPSAGQVKVKKQSSKQEYKLKEKENKEKKKKEKKAKKDKEKEKSTSPTSGTSSALSSSAEKPRKEPKKKAPMPIPQPSQQIAQKRIIDHHEYQNISEETKIDSKSPVMRMFGDTNFLLNHRRRAQNQNQKESGLSCGQGVCELMNGVYRFSPHVTSFAELESNKGSNRSHPSTMDAKEYHHLNVSKYLNIDVKTPNLRTVKHHHHRHHMSSNSSSLSSGSSGSNSLNSFDSVEQAIIFQKNKNADSYLGPFNFRQLLRPTQGPTESLRKRKGINPPSPPPLQRGKS
ncbi:myosin-IIIb isoform X1 [Aedes aegypti]|uniref:non-specific serine/threonine protein kinase n=2 Tax=Aedes aegypti TaxID=7159 RepID=A0A6I8TCN2_AEDAE|nr:myosin-IIIb isoform X1 [Aedes aegypti]XP_021707052.1 myosin-IIIb isoform X1 [Aedes aegypti]XP_021707053.1 myosin-IIIb isoform X1 [Aedes aegypti]XP_021707054.1 myosin-IIIb isoform X1 [Aedes aegypti]